MTGILLDTNVFLWFVTRDPRLKADPYSRLTAYQGPVYLSVVSGWEIAIKVGLGKLDVGKPFDELIGTPLSQHGIELLALSREHLIAYANLPTPESGHKDPFDRMLVVQAKSRGLNLMTSDAGLGVYGENVEVV